MKFLIIPHRGFSYTTDTQVSNETQELRVQSRKMQLKERGEGSRKQGRMYEPGHHLVDCAAESGRGCPAGHGEPLRGSCRDLASGDRKSPEGPASRGGGRGNSGRALEREWGGVFSLKGTL